MEKRKELFKTIILILLVASSIILTFEIAGYKPNYEILGIKQEKQKDEQYYTKIRTNTLNILSPYIIVEEDIAFREETAIPLAITKLGNVNAIKDRTIIKKILDNVANNKVEETRFRNKSIDDIIGDHKKKISISL